MESRAVKNPFSLPGEPAVAMPTGRGSEQVQGRRERLISGGVGLI